MQPSDGMILVIGPRLEGHSVIFLAIQTHLSCRFLLAVDSLGLRRSGSSSQIINQAQDFPEQVPRHRHLSQLERNVAAMSDNLGPDLHQLVAQRRHRPVLHLLRQSQCPHEVASRLGDWPYPKNAGRFRRQGGITPSFRRSSPWGRSSGRPSFYGSTKWTARHYASIHFTGERAP